MIAEVLSPIMVGLVLQRCAVGDQCRAGGLVMGRLRRPSVVNVVVGTSLAAMSRDWSVGSRQDEVPRRASEGGP